MSLSAKPLWQLTTRRVSRSPSCVEIWGLFGSLSTECAFFNFSPILLNSVWRQYYIWRAITRMIFTHCGIDTDVMGWIYIRRMRRNMVACYSLTAWWTWEIICTYCHVFEGGIGRIQCLLCEVFTDCYLLT